MGYFPPTDEAINPNDVVWFHAPSMKGPPSQESGALDEPNVFVFYRFEKQLFGFTPRSPFPVSGMHIGILSSVLHGITAGSVLQYRSGNSARIC
jgi:hypothetical protein